MELPWGWKPSLCFSGINCILLFFPFCLLIEVSSHVGKELLWLPLYLYLILKIQLKTVLKIKSFKLCIVPSKCSKSECMSP